MNPKALVLLAAHNGENFLKEQIISILSQKNVDIEILINLDSSKDKSYEIIMDFQNNSESESPIIDDESVVISKSNDTSDITPKSSNDPIVVSKIDYFSEFDVGLVIGIVVGIAIGISLLLIFRQKNS